MKPVFLSCILFIAFTLTLSANPDSTFYENTMEKKVFEQVSDSVPAAALDMFLAINYSEEDYEQIGDQWSEIELHTRLKFWKTGKYLICC